jgi:glycosyltransferase involved in cell wall biosynthesis
VIIPTYNRRELVQETIDSVLAQTYTDYEIIVVDDGSTDGTEEALAARYRDRIRYVWQENQGEAVALNRGIAMAKGEYIATLGSDDLWKREKLNRHVRVLDSHPEVCMVWCQAWLMDEEGNRIAVPPLGHDVQPDDLSLEMLLQRNTMLGAGSTCLIRRSALEAVGGFDPEICLGEDWDLWLRLRARWDIAFLPEPLASVRRYPNSQSLSDQNVEHALKDHLRVLDKAFAALPGCYEMEGLKNRAYGRVYWEAGLRFENVGQTSVALSNCSRAVVQHRFLRSIPDSALNELLYAPTGSLRPADRLHTMLGVMPDEYPEVKTFKRRVWGQYHGIRCFEAYRDQQPAVMRRHWLRAVWYDGGWLRNRGFLRIGLWAFTHRR